jgi:hypothetical protein
MPFNELYNVLSNKQSKEISRLGVCRTMFAINKSIGRNIEQGRVLSMTNRRNVIVLIGASVSGYIAGPNGDLEWLISRPKPQIKGTTRQGYLADGRR